MSSEQSIWGGSRWEQDFDIVLGIVKGVFVGIPTGEVAYTADGSLYTITEESKATNGLSEAYMIEEIVCAQPGRYVGCINLEECSETYDLVHDDAFEFQLSLFLDKLFGANVLCERSNHGYRINVWVGL